MANRKSNVKQHYVPQFYLKNFTNDKGKIAVYDTRRDIFYLSTSTKECFSRYFYDVNPGFLLRFSAKTGLTPEVIDDKIRVLSEDKASAVFKLLCKNVSEAGYDFLQEERTHFYNFLLIQFIRTPFYRDRLRYLIISFALRMDILNVDEFDYVDVIHNLLLLGLLEKLFNLDFNLNEDYHIFFDHLLAELLDIRKQIEDCKEIFLLNRTNLSFLTSNSPTKITWKNDPYGGLRVLATPMDRDKPVVDIGYLSELSTVYIPLSPSLSIFLFDKEVGNVLKMQSGIGIIEDYNSDLLLNLNYSIFLNSPSKVFAPTNDFSQYIQMKDSKINPMFNFNFSGSRNTPDDMHYL